MSKKTQFKRINEIKHKILYDNLGARTIFSCFFWLIIIILDKREKEDLSKKKPFQAATWNGL